MGFMSALATGCEVEPWHYEAISTIAEAYAILEETGLGTKSRHFDFSAASFYGMLSGARSTDATGMRERFVKHVPGPYLLMSAQMRDPSGTPLECCFASELERTLDPMVQIVYDETLYILLGGISHDGDLDPVRETVGKALKNLGVLCGVSRPFSDVDDILQSKWQADRALRIGSVVDSDHSVFFYDDLIADIVLDEITTRVPRACVEPLAIRDLRQRDSRSGTEYVKTLEHFLLCGRDRKTTAEALHIHRNTLSYRLDRIRETLGKGGCGVYETLYFALLRHAERMSRGNSAAGDEQELLDWGEKRS